jgi:small subunit ribosomal protein S24e
MKMEITKKKENPLMHRSEVYFTVEHVGESTPGRNAVAEELAKNVKAKRDCVVIDCFESVYGVGKSTGYAKVYDSKKCAIEFESKYLLKRNGILSDEEIAKAATSAKPAE